MGIVSSLDSNRYRFGDIRHCRIDRDILKIIARYARARLNPIINKNDYAKSNSPVPPLHFTNMQLCQNNQQQPIPASPVAAKPETGWIATATTARRTHQEPPPTAPYNPTSTSNGSAAATMR